ncbi:PspA/IM30 family protein [Paenibacillus paridis]|uniref:PspA/IM30 family protein n=1 Tax=Paenibacillus paridis TaxID=2583376 RepID=UPI001123DAEF|nr:PspA/IM30 family protein [Paenibacillus paridis]
MGILQRVVSMTKAAANEVLDKMENPVTMLNHYLRDLDEEIANTERESLHQQAQERVLQTKLSELKEQARYYESKAEQAAVEEREEEARTALEAKILYLDQHEETSKLLQLAKQAAFELGLRLESLKEEKVRLQEKRKELVLRMKKTDGTSGYSSSDPLHASSASRGFERIEQKLMEREAQRELSRGLYSFDSNQPGHEFQNEQRNARVDEELKRLLQKKSGN